MVSAVFPNETLTAPTWEALEDKLAAEPWNTADSREEFRENMCGRARMWSGKFDDASVIDGSSEDFLRHLAAHGVCQLKGTPGGAPTSDGLLDRASKTR